MPREDIRVNRNTLPSWRTERQYSLSDLVESCRLGQKRRVSVIIEKVDKIETLMSDFFYNTENHLRKNNKVVNAHSTFGEWY